MKIKVETTEELIKAVQNETEIIIVVGDLANNIEIVKEMSPYKWKTVFALLIAIAATTIPNPGEILEISLLVIASASAGFWIGYSLTWFVFNFIISGGKDALVKIRENYDQKREETELRLIRKDKNAKNIVFLGSKGSGKTTCWQILRGQSTDEKYKPTRYQEPIDSFILNSNGKKMRIAKTEDIGGDDINVKYYDNIICHSSTIVFFLVDLNKLDENELNCQIRSRLQKISTLIKKDKLEKCKIQLIGTQLRRYKQQEKYKGDEETLQYRIQEWLHLNDLEGFDIDLLKDTVYCLELQEQEAKNKIVELVNDL